MAGCCPYAACTYAAPIVLAAPSLLAKFRSSPPATQAISLALLPFVFAALASSAGVDVAGFAKCVANCSRTRNTVVTGAIFYGAFVYKFATAAPPPADAKAAPASCPFSGAKTAPGATCPATGAK